MTSFHVVAGEIVELWLFTDTLSLRQQLEAVLHHRALPVSKI